LRRSRPKRSRSCARPRRSSSGRCCSSPAGKIRPSCCASRRRRSVRSLSVPDHARGYGHNFPEALAFRERRVAELGERLIVASVQRSIDRGRVREETGPRASRNRLQTITLLDAIAEHKFDAVFGGARRDEERSRAKERVFSLRDEFGQWDPRSQRPELWDLYNGMVRPASAGRVAGGVLKSNDTVVVLPHDTEERIASIETYDGPVDEAFPPMSVQVRLEEDVDVSRGDMLCRPANRPHIGRDLEATICSLSSRSLGVGNRLILLHTTRRTKATIQDLRYRLDISTLHRDEAASSLELNDIGRAAIRTNEPLFYDAYQRNRATGGFVLIDENTYDTAAAGTILAR